MVGPIFLSPSLDDMSFDSYCIVCDRLIIPPKEPESEAVKIVKKKSAAGTIRVSVAAPAVYASSTYGCGRLRTRMGPPRLERRLGRRSPVLDCLGIRPRRTGWQLSQR